MSDLQLIQQSWEKGISYLEYQSLMDKKIQLGAPDNETDSSYFQYTKLNQVRQKRWDKTFKIPQEFSHLLNRLQDRYNILVITEFWCGDSAHILPIVNKIVEQTSLLQMRIVFRDENPELMDQFLTSGSRSIPKLIFLDASTSEVKFTWGPRPSVATQMVEDFKKENGKLTPEFKEYLQLWYHKNKGENIVLDICNLLKI